MSAAYRGRAWWAPVPSRAKDFTLAFEPPPEVAYPRCPQPRILPESNESVRAIRALEAQLKETI